MTATITSVVYQSEKPLVYSRSKTSSGMYVSNIPQAIQAKRPWLELADMCKWNAHWLCVWKFSMGILDHLSRNSVFSGNFPFSSAFWPGKTNNVYHLHSNQTFPDLGDKLSTTWTQKSNGLLTKTMALHMYFNLTPFSLCQSLFPALTAVKVNNCELSVNLFGRLRQTSMFILFVCFLL